jgi:hypothetical protein
MPEVIETTTVDAPAKVPVDVVANESRISDFAAYQAAKRGDLPPVKETEKVAPTDPEKPAVKEAEGETPSSDSKEELESDAETDQKETTQEKTGEDKPKKKANPIDPRITELTRQRNIARDENAQLKAKLQEFEKLPQSPAVPDTGEPKKPVRPRLDDPKLDTTEKYETAMDQYETDRAKWDDFNRQKSQREEAVQRQTRELGERFQGSVAKAIDEKRFGDDFKPFAPVQEGGPPVSQLMMAVLLRADDPPAILNFLQHNPKFAEQLHDVKEPAVLAYQMGKIEGRILESEKAAKSAAPSSPVDNKQPEKPSTPKPAQKPPTILKGSGDPPTQKLNDADKFEDYQRLKKAGARL